MNNATLGSQLKKYRELNHYTQKQIGNYLNIQRQTYSNYERGIRTPDPKTLASLAALYQISLDDLLLTNTLKDNSRPEFYHEGVIAPSNSRIHLSGTEAKLLMDYRSLPQNYRETLLLNVKFLKAEASNNGLI